MILDEFGKPLPSVQAVEKISSIPSMGSGGWYPVVRESFSGAWQRNITINRETVLAFHAVYSCMTLIASDIAKLRLKLIEADSSDIWIETKNPAYTPVLRQPNSYQNRIQFWENWILSKLMRGNTYVLKQRDNRGVVTKLFVLDPLRVKPLVSDDGAVFYEISADNLTGVGETVTVPAREIIHDRHNCLFHPLVGMSAIFANGMSAMQGTAIQSNSTWFFDNRSMPGGILTAPGTITGDVAQRLKEQWTENFGGKNIGKIAVLGDGLKFEKQPMISAIDSQLIDQLKWTSEIVCSTFHVPPYKIGVGAAPSYNNVQALNIEYYSQCLQILIEAAELCIDEGLSLPSDIGVEFDLDGLLRMDSVSLITSVGTAVGAGVMAPNEGRKKMDLRPTKGGESPYLQQQNYSLAALAKRDAQDDPFASKTAPATPPAEGEDAADDEGEAANDNAKQASIALDEITAGLGGHVV